MSGSTKYTITATSAYIMRLALAQEAFEGRIILPCRHDERPEINCILSLRLDRGDLEVEYIGAVNIMPIKPIQGPVSINTSAMLIRDNLPVSWAELSKKWEDIGAEWDFYNLCLLLSEIHLSKVSKRVDYAPSPDDQDQAIREYDQAKWASAALQIIISRYQKINQQKVIVERPIAEGDWS